ncbi:MAG: DNA-3-methyladenine glycosylase I [Nitrospirales bacterium]|nr:MAG: DNA-3-methyladenine glycosylase I [Nitrospirales bacterium]
MTRCAWATQELLVTYHDREWGVPLHDDQQLFEFLILEGMQAGLSWHTILRKRQAFRLAFDNFEAEKMSRYSQKTIQQLLQNPDIIRNKLKITAAIDNAKSYLAIQKTFESFDRYIWQFIDGTPVQNRWRHHQDVPCRSTISDTLSQDLKQRGFSFVGPTICYAFMQATGMVNDHTTDCFRYAQLQSRDKHSSLN